MIDALTALIDEVRLLYNQFMEILEDLHGESGLTPSQRAVLEHLLRGGATVPSLARERGVTRQHIQMIVNDLVELGLVEARDNPAHKRSPLIGLTVDGERKIRAAIVREQGFMGTHLAELEVDDVRAAALTLSRFREACSAGVQFERASASPQRTTIESERTFQ